MLSGKSSSLRSKNANPVGADKIRAGKWTHTRFAQFSTRAFRRRCANRAPARPAACRSRSRAPGSSVVDSLSPFALGEMTARYRSRNSCGLRPARKFASVLTPRSPNRVRRTRRRACSLPQKVWPHWCFAGVRFGQGFLREATGLKHRKFGKPLTAYSCATSPALHEAVKGPVQPSQVKSLAPGFAGRYKTGVERRCIMGQREFPGA